MIKVDRELKVEHRFLNEAEAKIFAFFLALEEFRHYTDIMLIGETLNWLSEKRGIDPDEARGKVREFIMELISEEEEIKPGGTD